MSTRVERAGTFLWTVYKDWRYWTLLAVATAVGFWMEWALPWMPTWMQCAIAAAGSGAATAWLMVRINTERGEQP